MSGIPRFFQNEEITYIPDPMAAENTFLGKPRKTVSLPKYSDIRHQLPVPYWTGHESTLRCYDKAWELAFSNLHNPFRDTAFVSPFIDAAFNGCIEVITNLIGKVTAPLGASLLGCFTGGTAKWSIMLLYETGILLLALAPFVPGSV